MAQEFPLSPVQQGIGTSVWGLVNIVLSQWYRVIYNLVASVGTPIHGEVPVGVVDGSNKVFTLSAIPNPVLSLQFFVWTAGFGGILQFQTIDYTLVGKVVTMGVAPVAGGKVLAYYIS